MKRIKLLPENLINQIAAGEVIERPASAVKELVENSIDAGAKKVEIEISNGARDIRVADNGHGIHKDDLVLAFSRHATSKIQNQKDLWSINTLGFRGEALASIISVAKVSCITRTVDENNGLKAECKDSEVKISETGCAIGTIMEVKDLFYNIPARLKFLKQTQTEISNITEILQNIAISHPEVAVNLVHKKHSVIKTSGSSDLAVTISEIYSKDLIKELSEINFEDTQFNLNIKGFISNPDFTRSNKKAVYVFVNGRTVKCPIISKAIDTALKDLIPSGKYPFAALNITMPANEIDVNVHPSKRELKYTKPNLIFNFVYSAIKNALEGTYLKLHSSNDETQSCHSEGFSPKNLSNNEISEMDRSFVSLRMTEETQNSINDSKIIDFSRFADLRDDEITEISIPAKRYGSDVFQNKIELSLENNEKSYVEKPKIIGQLNNTYILIEAAEGLQVIDQHIAHERYLYEQLKENKTQISQLLLTSELIKPETEQILTLQENTELLEKYGFELDFVSQGVKLKRIPQMLANKNPEKIIFDLIEAIQTTPENMENEILERIACRAAVKAGEKLSLWQMEELIVNWLDTKFNKTCPHGRKISHTIPSKEIAKFFGRMV
ncbi:MAG TPA: DNA mismatch repair endonuclease MutL [Cyanobacteria bacterium UBA9971]|nr:DNA mismatch repair endonuclease MutL [Cyanobacteria bacterium UBA9971]